MTDLQLPEGQDELLDFTHETEEGVEDILMGPDMMQAPT